MIERNDQFRGAFHLSNYTIYSVHIFPSDIKQQRYIRIQR